MTTGHMEAPTQQPEQAHRAVGQQCGHTSSMCTVSDVNLSAAVNMWLSTTSSVTLTVQGMLPVQLLTTRPTLLTCYPAARCWYCSVACPGCSAWMLNGPTRPI